MHMVQKNAKMLFWTSLALKKSQVLQEYYGIKLEKEINKLRNFFRIFFQHFCAHHPLLCKAGIEIILK